MSARAENSCPVWNMFEEEVRKNTIAEFPYISWPMQLIKFTFKRICLSCLPFLTPVL